MNKPVFFLLFILSSAFIPIARGQIQLNPAPTRAVGQVNLTQGSPNLVEGRELNNPRGIALDTTVNPPALYIADTANNRVLGFRNATAFVNGTQADLVIGQLDFLSTGSQGPGTSNSIGLSLPTGLAVDSNGALYVVDSGNNRVLRFPAPFTQSGHVPFPDFVIGQSSFNTNTANAGGVSATSLLLNNFSGAVYQAYLNFDPNGNLWVADAGNNRVLRYPVTALGSGASNRPPADIVIGQVDFATNTYVNPNNDPSYTSAILTPTGVAFDSAGRLFVSESVSNQRGRILIYNPPFANGKAATRLLGVVPSSVSPQPPSVSEQQFGNSSGAIFILNNGISIDDTANNRILVFKPVDQFTNNFQTQQAIAVIGQPDFSSNQPNQGQPETAGDRLFNPQAAVATDAEVYIADGGNNRVIVTPFSGSDPPVFSPATRALGQDAINLNAPNLVEGREFRFIGSSLTASGIVTDNTSNPPHLYVADTLNNRVLGFKDLRTVKQGSKADLVIGQPDLSRVLINYPTNDANRPSSSSLFAPTGLALDAAGNLYVADSGNSRVLRFPAPFANPQTLPSANLILGQQSFKGPAITTPTASTLAFPFGLAFAGDNGLLVSDNAQNRVLFFKGSSASLTNGMTASNVFGQPDFVSSASGSADNRFSGPRMISTDSSDRLYVADTGNNRVSIYNRVTAAGPDPRPGTTLTGLNRPQGVFVNRVTGEIWVANTGANQMLRYPDFNSLPITGNTPNATIPDGAAPLALTQDAYGDLYTVDTFNRVIINFPGLQIVNAANLVQNRALAPGTIGSIFGFANQFGTNTQAAVPPLPTQMANVQVLLNGSPIPLYYVSPAQINFVVPNGAPMSGSVDLLVQRSDTQQVLGDFPLQLDTASPAIFTSGSGGNGQVAAVNQDGTLNSKDHPATNGSIVAFYGTGQGFIPDAPPDGTAPSGAVPTPFTPTVIIGTNATNNPVPPDYVKYSGLAPGLVGVWQVNVLIPQEVAPTSAVPNTPVVFVVNSIPSNGFSNARLTTTMWVSQPPAAPK